jgi:hypothetical protein
MFSTTALRSIATAGAVVSLALTASGCGRLIEKATEEAVEKVVEEAIEADTDDEVDVEFNDDGITVESEEVEFNLSVDENDIDSDGTFTATDEDGNVTTGEATQDGGFTVEGEDGESVFQSGPGIPDQWPSDVPEPSGLTDPQGTYIANGDAVNIVVTGQTDGDLDDVFDSYVSELKSAGYTEESTFTQAGQAVSGSFIKDDRRVSVAVSAVGGTTEMVVAIN